MNTGYSKREKIEPWVSKNEGKGTQSEPRDTKSEAKESQRGPKGKQKRASGNQKWAKSDPNSIKINIKDRVSKKMRKKVSAAISFGSILGAFFIKNR